MINELTDQEKSAKLCNQIGWYVFDRYDNDNPALWGPDEELIDGRWMEGIPDLYEPDFMNIAWRVMKGSALQSAVIDALIWDGWL